MTSRNKKYRIKSKFRFITFLVIVIGITVGIFNICFGLNETTALTKTESTQIEICAGDTLWDIARDYVGNDKDVRKAIYEICEYNDIDAGDIYPGMIISIPESL